MTLAASTLRLNWDHATKLAPTLSPIDETEVVTMGRSPLDALAYAAMLPQSQAVFNLEGDIKGAYGWTNQGTIWSLFGGLTKGESLQVLKHTKARVIACLEDSKQPFLCNIIWEQNRRGIRWLKASQCFSIDPYLKAVGGLGFHYFQTKPIEEIAAHV